MKDDNDRQSSIKVEGEAAAPYGPYREAEVLAYILGPNGRPGRAWVEQLGLHVA